MAMVSNGVHGVGKSTNLCQAAYWLLDNGVEVGVAARDALRAGAVEQLRTHVQRLSASFPGRQAVREGPGGRGVRRDPAGEQGRHRRGARGHRGEDAGQPAADARARGARVRQRAGHASRSWSARRSSATTRSTAINRSINQSPCMSTGRTRSCSHGRPSGWTAPTAQLLLSVSGSSRASSSRRSFLSVCRLSQAGVASRRPLRGSARAPPPAPAAPQQLCPIHETHLRAHALRPPRVLRERRLRQGPVVPPDGDRGRAASLQLLAPRCDARRGAAVRPLVGAPQSARPAGPARGRRPRRRPRWSSSRPGRRRPRGGSPPAPARRGTRS